MRYAYPNELYHHGILGMHWGVRNGPPYPLGSSDHSASEKKAGWRKSLGSNAKDTYKKVRSKANAGVDKSKQIGSKINDETKKVGSKISGEAKKVKNDTVDKSLKDRWNGLSDTQKKLIIGSAAAIALGAAVYAGYRINYSNAQKRQLLAMGAGFDKYVVKGRNALNNTIETVSAKKAINGGYMDISYDIFKAADGHATTSSNFKMRPIKTNKFVSNRAFDKSVSKEMSTEDFQNTYSSLKDYWSNRGYSRKNNIIYEVNSNPISLNINDYTKYYENLIGEFVSELGPLPLKT